MGDGYVKDHLQPFVDQCKPPILSYDNYPIGENVEFSYGYWANMWDVRSVALKNNIPFHTILLTAAHFNYRVPTAADLRLQIFGRWRTALAGWATTSSAASRCRCSTHPTSATSAARSTNSAKRPASGTTCETSTARC